jgi:hypothetical protein
MIRFATVTAASCWFSAPSWMMANSSPPSRARTSVWRSDDFRRPASSWSSEQCAASFARLQLETARKAMKFYRLREQTNKPPAGDRTTDRTH